MNPASSRRPSGRSSDRCYRRSAARLAWCAGCLACALLASAARADAPIRIELRPAVEVERSRVTLGDVAVVRAREAATLRRLSELPLGSAPAPGEVARFDRARLLRWIHARTGLDAADIAWGGSSASEIRRATRQLAGETIAARAAESVRADLSRGGRRVELSTAQPTRDLAVPAGRVALKVRPLPQTAVVPKRLSVWVDVSVDDVFVRTVPVDLEVAVFGPAYVAAADEPVGSVLESSAFSVREVEWSGRSPPPLDPSSAGPWRLRRPLSAGRAVTREQVEAAPLVTRGGWAILRATQGMVTLESRVEVLQDGRSGQSVQVKVPDASSAIFARVTGPGTVEVGP